ncbi:hypothetical protein MPSEU_000465000 [Mayamaea pseudoterrestris]|nr:hypothetical protein MPSEU_000465000 [Mayamaea pseudoterrestris]
MKLSSTRRVVQLMLLFSHVFIATSQQQQQQQQAFTDFDTLFWSSTGGGWRSMVADMGFANVFGRAGLINATSSAFQSISTNSGASWFALQFFYSPIFFDKTLASSSIELGIFVTQWMLAYQRIFKDVPNDPNCGFGADNLLQQLFGEECDLFVYFQGDWANFTQTMFQAVSAGYGDEGLADRLATSEDRVSALQSTNLMIQMVLAANSRVPPKQNGTNAAGGTMAYLGPASQDNTIYTAPITLQYTVTDDSADYFKAAPDEITNVYNGPAIVNATLSAYRPFYLYPPPANASVTVSTSTLQQTPTLAGQMRAFFGGDAPTLNQLAAPSSAAVGAFSGLVPSVMAQLNSVALHAIRTDNETGTSAKQFILNVYRKGLSQLYNSELAYDVAVCSQWPKPCTDLDGRFIDGGYTDPGSLALALGQYHQNGGNLDKTLKVILTNTNEVSNETDSHPILPYFSNPGNAKVEPGMYYWPPDSIPMPSLQIFGEELDYDSLYKQLQPIKGTTLMTGVVKAMTIDNEAYGVFAGQHVEIMLIDLNAAIPTVLVGPLTVAAYVAPLAAMAVEIASSDALLNQIKTFTSSNAASDGGEGDTMGTSSSRATAKKAFAALVGMALNLIVAICSS